MIFDNDIESCLPVLENGGVILYPTDTIWGIGCDATNPEAVRKLYAIKKRSESKAMIVLLPDARQLYKYITQLDPMIFDYLESLDHITTVIYPGATGLADNLVADDGSIAIRIVKEDFCRHLLRRFRKPIVSTSANISGSPPPASFAYIDPAILSAVDYIVKYRQEETIPSSPSRVVKWEKGRPLVIRP